MEQLIGSGILDNVSVAIGLGGMVIGGLGMWTVCLRRFDDDRATIARLSDTVGQLQYKRDKTLEYCKQFRVRGAKVACILGGEQDQ